MFYSRKLSKTMTDMSYLVTPHPPHTVPNLVHMLCLLGDGPFLLTAWCARHWPGLAVLSDLGQCPRPVNDAAGHGVRGGDRLRLSAGGTALGELGLDHGAGVVGGQGLGFSWKGEVVLTQKFYPISTTYISDLVHDSGTSIANAMRVPESCAKFLISCETW